MAKRLTMVLVALPACGLAAAGCGDDDKDNAKNDNTTTVTKETTTAAPDSSGGSAATGVPATPQAKQAVEACKKQTDANPQLSAKAKKQIGVVCEEAGTGDANGAIKATRKACEIIVNDTAPAGAAKQTALAACKQSTTTP